MKTIQQVLNELDKDKIVEAYFYNHPINLWELREYDDIKIGDFNSKAGMHLGDFIDKLRKFETIEKPEQQGILFVYKSCRDFNSDEEYGLIHAEELLAADDLSKVLTYAYEFSEWKETLTFLVADNKLTQDNLMDLVVDYLYESSFFGYDQENLEKEIQALEESAKEAKEHPERLISWEEIRSKYGLPEIEEYPREEELSDAYYKASMEYNTYCRVVELERIKESLLRENA